jgi:IS30 family transposase
MNRFRLSIRDIAKGLERAVSTVSREDARHGGRPRYRANGILT